MPSPVSFGADRLLSLLRQAGAVGATPCELSGWAGISENQVSTHLRALSRRQDAVPTGSTRLTPRGGAQKVWVAKEAA